MLLILALIVIIIQLILAIISLVLAIIGAIPFALILVVVIVVDIFNGAPAPTHDLLQAVGNVLQSVIQFIGNIRFS
jgi:hypothetical protein